MFYWIMNDGRIVTADHLPIGPIGAAWLIVAAGVLPYAMGCSYTPVLQR